MTSRAKTALAVLVAVAVGAVFLWRRSGETPANAPPATARSAPPEISAETRPAGADAGPQAAAPSPRKRLDRESRDRLATALAAARTARRRGAPTYEAPPSEPLSLRDRTGDDSAWESRQVDVLSQLLGECYDLARVDDPDLAGSVVLLFEVSGEPDIGGLVDDVRFDETGTTIASSTLRECVQESLYALELDPPPEGVSVARQLSLELHP